MRAALWTVLLLGACGRDKTEVTPAAPGGPSPPVGSEYCAGDDKVGVPFATSTFVSKLPLEAARTELGQINGFCPDTFCEGSFDWAFYDLRSDDAKSEITMRVYSEHKDPKVGDASKVIVRGPGYVGRVLAQRVVPWCTSPCKWKEPPRWEPCLTLDLRCDIEAPWTKSSEAWSKVFIDCNGALERAVREIHPER